jgi:hypothetical protein
MAFEQQINKTESVGAYRIIFNDETKMAQIGYNATDENGVKTFVKDVSIPFEKLAQDDAELFNSIIAGIQILCDSYNPANPDKLEPEIS